MTLNTKNTGLSLIYIIGSLIFLLIDFSLFLGLAIEANGGFMDPGPIGPYENMVGKFSNYIAIPSLIIFLLIIPSFFIYPQLLGEKKDYMAKKIWIILWGLLLFLGVNFYTLPSIAKFLTK